MMQYRSSKLKLLFALNVLQCICNLSYTKPESEAELRRIIENVFGDQGQPLSIDELKKEIKTAKSLHQLNYVQATTQRLNVENLEYLDAMIKGHQCYENTVTEFIKGLQSIGEEAIRLNPLLVHFRQEMIRECLDYIPRYIGSVQFAVQPNADWIKLRAILKERNLGLEALLKLRLGEPESSDRDQLLEVSLDLLKTLEPMRKDANMNWHGYRMETISKWDSLMIGMCKFRGQLQLDFMSNLGQLDGKFWNSIDSVLIDVVERYLVCKYILDYHYSTIYDAFVGLNYDSDELYHLIFDPNAPPLEPSETSMLIRVLSNYRKLSGKPTGRKQEIRIQTAQTMMIPNRPFHAGCSLQDLESFETFATTRRPMSNINSYRRHFISLYLTNCTSNSISSLLNTIRKPSLNPFNNFARHLVAVHQNSFPIEISSQSKQRAIIEVVAKLLLLFGYRMGRTRAQNRRKLNTGLKFIDDMCMIAIHHLGAIESWINTILASLDPYWYSYMRKKLNNGSISILFAVRACKYIFETRIEPEVLNDAIASKLFNPI